MTKPAQSEEYAGIIMWVGLLKIKVVIPKELLDNEAEPGTILTDAAQHCLDSLEKELSK